MNRYNLYLKQILDFLRTMTVKNRWFAERSKQKYFIAIQQPNGDHVGRITPRKSINEISDYEVPYYWRIAGLIHPLDPWAEDTPDLSVIGIDNTKLCGHSLAKSEGARALSKLRLPREGMDLLQKEYPNRRDFIKSIIYPPTPPEDFDGFVRSLNLTQGDMEKFANRTFVRPGQMEWQEVNSYIELLEDSAEVHHTEYIKALMAYRQEQDASNSFDPNSDLDWGIVRGRLHAAVSAPHLSLFSYDEGLLEQWERPSMITAVYNALDYLKERWAVDEFTGEEGYSTMFWAHLWEYLHMALHLQRVKNIRTNVPDWGPDSIPADVSSENHTVHSYHIREYLSSKGLGDYSDVLGRKQSLFLYYNLNWLIKNKGKRLVHTLLSNWLLEPGKSELLAKPMMFNTTRATKECTLEPEFLSTSTLDDRNPKQYLRASHESYSEIMERCYKSGLEPLDNEPSIPERMEGVLETSNQTLLNTPLFEINRIPLYEGMEERYINFAFSTLFHEWGAGRFGASVGSEQILLSPEYATSRVYGNFRDYVYLLSYICMRLTKHATSETDVPDWELPTHFPCGMVVDTPTDVGNIAFEYGFENTSPPSGSYIEEDDFPETFTWWEKTGDVFESREYRISGLIGDNVAAWHNSFAPGEKLGDEVLIRYNAVKNVDSEEGDNWDPDTNVYAHHYMNIESLGKEIDRRFETMFEMFVSARSSADPKVREAVRAVLNNCTATYMLEKDPPAGYVKYSDWLDERGTLANVIIMHENENIEYATWTAYLEFLLTRSVPILNSKWVAEGSISRYAYDRIVNLFKSLASYNVCYLGRNQTDSTYWKEFRPIGLEARPHGTIGLDLRLYTGTIARFKDLVEEE